MNILIIFILKYLKLKIYNNFILFKIYFNLLYTLIDN